MKETITKKGIVVIEKEKPLKLNKYEFHCSHYGCDTQTFQKLVKEAGGRVDYMIMTYFANTLKRGYIIYYFAPNPINMAVCC